MRATIEPKGSRLITDEAEGKNSEEAPEESSVRSSNLSEEAAEEH